MSSGHAVLCAVCVWAVEACSACGMDGCDAGTPAEPYGRDAGACFVRVLSVCVCMCVCVSPCLFVCGRCVCFFLLHLLSSLCMSCDERKAVASLALKSTQHHTFTHRAPTFHAPCGPLPPSTSLSNTHTITYMRARLHIISHTLSYYYTQGPDLSCTMWALASLRHTPSPQWVSAALMRSEHCVRTFGSGPSVASMLWGVAVLRCAPPGAWMEHFLMQVSACLVSCVCVCVCV